MKKLVTAAAIWAIGVFCMWGHGFGLGLLGFIMATVGFTVFVLEAFD